MRAKRSVKKFQSIKWVIGFFIGAAILLYPTVSDLWNSYRNDRLTQNYQEAAEQLDQKDYSKLWEEARAYNAAHLHNRIVDAFEENEQAEEQDEAYEKLLQVEGSEVMGYIEIPKIQIRLPIFHSVRPEVLEKGSGHIQGTSLPIGGEGTHAVLSAHRGLPNMRMFSDLDQLTHGDVFLIRILDQTLAYRVRAIKTVLPTRTQDLAIEAEEDLVTLITCTPYGVNTHRLLVQAERTAYHEDEDVKMQTTVLRSPLEGGRSNGQKMLVIALGGFIVFLIGLNVAIEIRYRRRKRNKDKEALCEKLQE